MTQEKLWILISYTFVLQYDTATQYTSLPCTVDKNADASQTLDLQFPIRNPIVMPEPSRDYQKERDGIFPFSAHINVIRKLILEKKSH